MDVFRTDRIRNVVLLGHGGAGKTTLAEAMAYLAGMTNRLGRVEDGNTVSAPRWLLLPCLLHRAMTDNLLS